MERLGKLDVIFQLTCHRTTLDSVPRNVRYKNTNRRTIDIPQHFIESHFLGFFKNGMKLGSDPWFLTQGRLKLICMANFPKKSHEMKQN